MDHDADREREGRALLVAAVADAPGDTDLLGELRRRVRRRRARRRLLVPSLATLGTAAVVAVAALLASVVTGAGTSSAQARVAAAAGRTATQSYRVRIVQTAGDETRSMEGVFDPARRTGRLVIEEDRLEVRFLGDTAYMELPAAARPPGKRWLAQDRSLDPRADVPVTARLLKQAWQDPQQELARLRSAAAVREQGRVSGAGWSGVRYSFELTDDHDLKHGRVTGTVELDQADRVRQLVVTTPAPGTGATLRTVMEFYDYGAKATVSAPPAGQVARASELPAGKKPVPSKEGSEKKPTRP